MTLKERVYKAVDAYMVYHRVFTKGYQHTEGIRQTASQYITEAQTGHSGEYQSRIVAVANKIIHRRIVKLKERLNRLYR